MHRGCFVWTLTPLLAGRRTPRRGPVRVCVCSSVLAGSGGPASRARSGAPHLFLWPLCLSALLGPLQAGFVPVLVLCFSAVSPFALVFFFPFLRCFFFPRAPFVSCFFWFPALGGLGLGALCCLFCWPRASWLSVRSCFPCVAWPLAALRWLPPPTLSLAVVAVPCCPALVSFFFFLSAPPCFRLSAFSGSGCPGLWRWFVFVVLGSLCSVLMFFSAPRFFLRSRLFCVPSLAAGCCPPPLLCLAVFVVFARCLGFFFLSSCAPLLSPAFSGFQRRVPWALALCLVCLSRPPAARLSVRTRLVCVSRLALGCSLVVAAPPPLPFCVSSFSSLLLGALVFFFFLCAPALSLAFSGFWPRVPRASALCVVCFVNLPILGLMDCLIGKLRESTYNLYVERQNQGDPLPYD